MRRLLQLVGSQMGSVNVAVYANGASGELILSIRNYTRDLERTKL